MGAFEEVLIHDRPITSQVLYPRANPPKMSKVITGKLVVEYVCNRHASLDMKTNRSLHICPRK